MTFPARSCTSTRDPWGHRGEYWLTSNLGRALTVKCRWTELSWTRSQFSPDDTSPSSLSRPIEPIDTLLRTETFSRLIFSWECVQCFWQDPCPLLVTHAHTLGPHANANKLTSTLAYCGLLFFTKNRYMVHNTWLFANTFFAFMALNKVSFLATGHN